LFDGFGLVRFEGIALAAYFPDCYLDAHAWNDNFTLMNTFYETHKLQEITKLPH